MTRLSFSKCLLTFSIVAFCILAHAQPVQATTPPAKPYKILTSGRQITVKSNKDIKAVMVWTASGHRIIEQKDINAPSFTFNINVAEKYFFVMIQYEGQKPFTEKIGVQ